MHEVKKKTRLLNDGWLFLKTKMNVIFEEMAAREPEFAPVCLPHDWLIYHADNLYEDSWGWYKRRLLVETLNEGERIFLAFDGVYMDCSVYINNHKLGDWKYGYSAFEFELTPLLKKGENEILVLVRHQSPNSRWYSGAGIYRNVHLITRPAASILDNGVYVCVKKAGNGYELTVNTAVSGGMGSGMYCHYSLWQEGKHIQDLGRGAVNESCIAAVGEIEEWSLESPVCYTLRAELKQSDRGEVLDTEETTIGFREIRFCPREGLFLNGKNIKIHGVCEHHDLGCLGAAFSREAMRRRLEILKAMGVNGLRVSHNMPAKEVMDLCDRMGFLVISEAFDMWERSKNPYDYARFFKEWMKRDVKSWIRRDRNHPSLLLWSIGNEIYDTHADQRGQEITRELIKEVRIHDPGSNALITIASNYMPWENARKCADLVKIAGYNYGEKYYKEHHKAHPDWVIYGSETCSVTQSRGIYRFPLSQTLLSDDDEQCSALGNSITSWGTRSLEACIADDLNTEYSFGQFIWTGFDYLGEPTPYHTRSSYLGQIDTAGFPKDSYYMFQSAWTSLCDNPMVHVFPHWDFNPGQMIDVRACTTGAQVELFVNGRSQGVRQIDHRDPERLTGNWKVPYEAGQIKAVAYDAAGNKIASHIRKSFGDSFRLYLSANRTVLNADASDLAFVTIETVDIEGNKVETAMDYVSVKVSGAGVLLGLDNGDSTDPDPYKTTVRKLFNGKLVAVVGALKHPGIITISVQGHYLPETSITLAVRDALVEAGVGERSRRECAKADLDSFPVMVRKIEIQAEDGQCLTPEKNSLVVKAKVYPEHAADQGVIWKAVNHKGIEVPYVKVEGGQTAVVRAFGDGEFFVRCMSRSSREKVKIISSLEFRAEGFGESVLNPYVFVSAGLFAHSSGALENGNEKGVATTRDGITDITYDNLSFGDFGSDRLTLWVFALTGDQYPIEVWRGKPDDPGGRLLDTLIYQKPSIWNVYQSETFRLGERLSGNAVITLRLKAKVHIKGFQFEKQRKGCSRLRATENSRVYGDHFVVEEDAVKEIGNNVTLEFEDMDFGEKGVNKLVIHGFTGLSENSIHIHFTTADGLRKSQMVMFQGGSKGEQAFLIEPLSGTGKIEFVFLPGSNFDFYAFRFVENGQ